MGAVQVWAGQRLSYPDEKIYIGTAEELQTRNFDSLCAAVMEYPGGNPSAVQGLPDEAFLRTEAVPMTKSEVRAICLSKMALKEESLAWDIGAGTGSVTVEMAWNAWRGRVYAIERKKEAVDILRANCRNFHVDNVTIVSGTAPEDCRCAFDQPGHLRCISFPVPPLRTAGIFRRPRMLLLAAARET